ncbi:hypothetical protein VFPPC_17692 [Pochonia chlamydosporia 170]|uniref:Uncharacterized protein n=1 Tax=Pochonia chlamydosporia 170 TaxID=1380566 RepID=A0A219ARB1_METCM|nr:hypothetical protein VFPPC_17692 [Pochonia chlamydosporia 170]OWT43132.1 hypothetical protein VFPPC_17692 [Pochonia chlamydosporia 170]
MEMVCRPRDSTTATATATAPSWAYQHWAQEQAPDLTMPALTKDSFQVGKARRRALALASVLLCHHCYLVDSCCAERPDGMIIMLSCVGWRGLERGCKCTVGWPRCVVIQAE